MMIITQKCAVAKDKNWFFPGNEKTISAVFTAVEVWKVFHRQKYKVWEEVDIIPQYMAFKEAGIKKFSPTSTGFSTGKNCKIQSFLS